MSPVHNTSAKELPETAPAPIVTRNPIGARSPAPPLANPNATATSARQTSRASPSMRIPAIRIITCVDVGQAVRGISSIRTEPPRPLRNRDIPIVIPAWILPPSRANSRPTSRATNRRSVRPNRPASFRPNRPANIPANIPAKDRPNGRAAHRRKDRRVCLRAVRANRRAACLRAVRRVRRATVRAACLRDRPARSLPRCRATVRAACPRNRRARGRRVSRLLCLAVNLLRSHRPNHRVSQVNHLLRIHLKDVRILGLIVDGVFSTLGRADAIAP
mmetsp:Transcript_1468/g.2821  ORF Transcript_1468/g.2821 Transcript_1468/m.2821 type:complete len:275 (-) Transcript_1468:1360-2184(-)